MSVDHSNVTVKAEATFLHIRPGHLVIVGGELEPLSSDPLLEKTGRRTLPLGVQTNVYKWTQ